MTFLIPELVDPKGAHLAGKIGFVFAGLVVGCAVWGWGRVVETKGRTVGEVDALFERMTGERES